MKVIRIDWYVLVFTYFPQQSNSTNLFCAIWYLGFVVLYGPYTVSENICILYSFNDSVLWKRGNLRGNNRSFSCKNSNQDRLASSGIYLPQQSNSTILDWCLNSMHVTPFGSSIALLMLIKLLHPTECNQMKNC